MTSHCIFEINSTWKKISIHRTIQRLMAISMFESFAATLFYLQQVFLFAACPLWATVAADRLIDLWLYLFWFHNIQGLNLQINSPSLRQLLTRWEKLQQGWVCICVAKLVFISIFPPHRPTPPPPNAFISGQLISLKYAVMNICHLEIFRHKACEPLSPVQSSSSTQNKGFTLWRTQ